MKFTFTLENRPKPKDFPANKTRHLGVDMTAWKKADDEWFEGFEKQLRDLIKEIEAENDRILKDVNEDQLLPDSNAHAIMRSSYHNNGQILILKEILGDEK